MKNLFGLFTLVFIITFSVFSQNSCDIPGHFTTVTGQNMTVLLTEDFINELPELNENAYIVAHAANSAIVVGSTIVIEGEQALIAIWGDDPFTTPIDGAQDLEPYWLQLVNGNSIYNINDVIYDMGSNLYIPNGVGMITSSSIELFCSIDDVPSEDEIDYTLDNPCSSLYNYNSILLELNPIQSRSFNEGWNMFGFPCQDPRSVIETFLEIVSDLYIVKNNEGNFYWPEFDFDGLVNLIPLEGYQTNFHNPVDDFSFCESSINFPEVSGCIDCDALNYNPFATIDDFTCIQAIYGCTYGEYFNYNQNANIDDGSCVPYIYGCMNDMYLEFNPSANTDDGSCLTEIVYGCTASLYIEYNAAANVDDGSCFFIAVPGCSDPSALNYNEISPNWEYINDFPNQDVNIDDGSCISEITFSDFDHEYIETDNYMPIIIEDYLVNFGYGEIIPLHNGYPVFSSSPIDETGDAYFTAMGYEPGCNCNYPETGDEITFAILYNNQIINLDVSPPIIYATDVGAIEINPSYAQHEIIYTSEEGDTLVFGCLDELAYNYDVNATFDDQSCLYELQIGDYYAGGIVFYIDGSGEHGLVASDEDITEGQYFTEFQSGFRWGCTGQDYTGAEGTTLYTGYQNSQFIVDFTETQNCLAQITAAEKCLSYVHNGYDDWYLPSKDALLLMWSTIGPGPGGTSGNIGDFIVGTSYWSSSEGDVNLNTAWSVIFYDYNNSNGYPSDTGKTNLNKVRAVRSF
tara:strand:+ start:2876 stop:5104 length:2229 start_codon:yes stop_codon:yes gene_type:complete